MQKVVLDRPLPAELEGAMHEVELCDPSGKLIGYFVTPAVYESTYARFIELINQPNKLIPRREATGE